MLLVADARSARVLIMLVSIQSPEKNVYSTDDNIYFMLNNRILI